MIIFRSLRHLSIILDTLSIIDLTLAYVCETKLNNTLKENEICNGIIDCKTINEFDRKDEDFARCYDTKCDNENKFKCTYGGCLDRTLRCDGKPDCWDGSDENKFECFQGAALENAYKELYGDYQNEQLFACKEKPLEWSRVCDGRADCADGRDEDPTLCSAIECDSPAFKCLYGACISRESLCNHIPDCLDGSDEIKEICNEISGSIRGYQANSAWTVEYCSLQDPSNSLIAEDYTGQTTFQRNAKVLQGTVVLLSCPSGHRLIGEKLNVCNGDTWRHELARCEKGCKHIASVLHTSRCTLNGSLIDCDQPMLPQGTQMVVSCASGAENETPGLHVCNDEGNWDNKKPLPQCEPICGRWDMPNVQPSPPWLMSIFKRSQKAEFKFVCTATILSPYILVTSQHCFSDKEPVLFTVAEGLSKMQVFSQHLPHPYKLHNVSYIHTVRVGDNPLALVQLLQPLEFGFSVRPVCLTEEITKDPFQVINFSKRVMGDAVIDDSRIRGRYELTAIINPDSKYHISAFMDDIRKDIATTQANGNI